MEQLSTKDRYLIGFWYRLGANFWDAILIYLLVVMISLTLLVIEDISQSYGLFTEVSKAIKILYFITIMGIYYVGFWAKKSRTPGGYLLSHQVCHYKTGANITVKRALARYLCMIISAVPVFLGFFWVVWSKQKRSWYDIMSGTAVVSDESYSANQDDKAYVPIEVKISQ